MRVTPIALAPLSLLLAACGQTINTNPMLAHSTPAAPSSSAAAESSGPASPSASGSVSAQNVKVTDQLRADLVAAGAKERNLTPADFTGLQPGDTFYAYDPSTQTYWAGARLVPNPNSQNALVSSQDDGGYTLFEKSGSGAWQPKEAGMAGGPGSASTGCPLPIPASVVKLWGWPAGACHPAKF